jgi:hypothetical protein
MKTFPYIKLQIAGDAEQGWSIGGYDTYALKDHIKKAGGKWQPKTKTWSVPATATAASSMDAFYAELKSISENRRAERKVAAAAEKERVRLANTPEAKKQRVLDALAIKAKTGQYYWICCEECEVIDWHLAHTSCKACAVDCGLYKNTFRVRGAIFTGD